MALTDNIIAYWKFDESSGNASDATGNGYTLTNTSVTFGTSSGKIDNGASFNGTSSKLEKTSATGVSFGTGPFTVAMWINIQGAGTPGSNGRLFFIDNGGNTPRIFIDATTGTNNLQAQFYDGTNGAHAKTTISTSAWHHIVFVRDASSNAILYVDGAEAVRNSTTFGMPSNANLSGNQIKIGSGYEGTVGYYDGYADEVAIWNRALTSTEVSTLYNSGAGLQYPFSTPTSSASGAMLLAQMI